MNAIRKQTAAWNAVIMSKAMLPTQPTKNNKMLRSLNPSFSMKNVINMIYEVQNLHGAREYLEGSSHKVIVSNPAGSTRYYGMRVVHQIFKTLQEEFPDKISGVLVNVFDDYSALITAQELGYKNILFVGE